MITRAVLTRRYADELMDKGHNLVGTAPNTNRPNFIVYIFESTPEMEMDLAIIRQRARRKNQQPIAKENDNENSSEPESGNNRR